MARDQESWATQGLNLQRTIVQPSIAAIPSYEKEALKAK
jgi:hypothetical protein